MLGDLCVHCSASLSLERSLWQSGNWKRDLTGMGNGRGAEIIKIIHRPRKNIPGPVDDQRSEKDRPPQSGGCNFLSKKSLSKNQRTAFAQALLCRNIPASQVCPFPRRHDKKATLKNQSSFSMFLIQLSSFNPAGLLRAPPLTLHLTLLTLEFQIRLDLLWEWLTLLPKWAPLPQISHFAMIAPPQTIFVVWLTTSVW